MHTSRGRRFHDLVFGHELGRGSFSTVKYARQILRPEASPPPGETAAEAKVRAGSGGSGSSGSGSGGGGGVVAAVWRQSSAAAAASRQPQRELRQW